MTLPPSTLPRLLASIGSANSEYSETDSRTKRPAGSELKLGRASSGSFRRRLRPGGAAFHWQTRQPIRARRASNPFLKHIGCGSVHLRLVERRRRHETERHRRRHQTETAYIHIAHSRRCRSRACVFRRVARRVPVCCPARGIRPKKRRPEANVAARSRGSIRIAPREKNTGTPLLGIVARRCQTESRF